MYFDDFKVTHTKTPVVQYNEYYPFGLNSSASWTRDGTSNNFLANGGTELNTGTGWYDLNYRNYDPVLGRFHQVDPVALKYSSLSPYNFGFNNPVYFNDPSGADPLADVLNWIFSMMYGAQMSATADDGRGGAYAIAYKRMAKIQAMGGHFTAGQMQGVSSGMGDVLTAGNQILGMEAALKQARKAPGNVRNLPGRLRVANPGH